VLEEELGVKVGTLHEDVFPDARYSAFIDQASDGCEIHLVADDHYALVIYGETTPLTPATALALCHRDGVDAMIGQICGGDGSFGAMLWDRKAGTVRLFCDVTGQRSLRFTTEGDGSLCVSSHDIGLVIGAGLTPRVDASALRMTGAIGWPVATGSLLEGVTVCPPFECTVLSPKPDREASEFSVRLDPISSPEPAGSTLMEMSLEWLGRSTGGSGDIVVELSAGFDSRASTAATLAVADPHRIRAFSEGPAESEDVTVAREIAKRAGIAFERRETTKMPADAFLDAWSRSTVASNGCADVSALVSRSLDAERADAPTTICGDGGETFRGYFYPYRPLERTLRPPIASARRALFSKFSGAKAFQTPEAAGDLRAKLDLVTERLGRVSASEAEILDRYFVTERFGIWNQTLVRDAANRNRVSPFYSRRAIMAALALPEPMGWTNALHTNLVRAFLPAAMDLPLNGEASASRHEPGLLNSLRLDWSVFAGKVERKLRRKLGFRRAELEDDREAIIVGLVDTILGGTPADLISAGTVLDTAGYSVPERIGVYGWGVWTELGALRFIRICERVHATRRARGNRGPEPALHPSEISV